MNKSNIKRRNIIIIFATIAVIVLASSLAILQTLKGGSSAAFNTESDFIEFIDVGQGDCALIYSNGYCALIDLGEPSFASNIRKTLNNYKIKTIDALIISHLHYDHIGALPELVDLYKTDNLFMPPLTDQSLISAKTGKQIAIDNGADVYDTLPGISFNIGEFEITILGSSQSSDDTNASSVFVMAKIGDKKVLFTGDAQKSDENKLLENNVNIDCDILKVAHHGAASSSDKKFLTAASPKYAVISVGKDNSYNHPDKATLKALDSIGTKIYRTDQDGNIKFLFNDNKIITKTEK